MLPKPVVKKTQKIYDKEGQNWANRTESIASPLSF